MSYYAAGWAITIVEKKFEVAVSIMHSTLSMDSRARIPLILSNIDK